MSDQATPNKDILTSIQAGDVFLLTREEMRLLLPWIHTTLQGQPKEEHNSDLCQLFTRILRLSNRLYGTERGNKETCICYG
ncbi:hypothetical protein [Streptomyces sp. A5-4]|uniref:hypothetical protein n=1 Tax=Streptomyces sp. A5-4 TaxID=3384771 RepID=UPI003DA83279